MLELADMSVTSLSSSAVVMDTEHTKSCILVPARSVFYRIDHTRNSPHNAILSTEPIGSVLVRVSMP